LFVYRVLMALGQHGHLLRRHPVAGRAVEVEITFGDLAARPKAEG